MGVRNDLTSSYGPNVFMLGDPSLDPTVLAV